MPSLFDSDGAAPTSVAFRTIGCKLNQCETAQMQETLVASGYRLVDWSDRADVRVVNTCTVTAKSDRTCRHEIRLAKRLDPECVVAVTGCYAQVDPDAVAAIPGVNLVLGNIEKMRLKDYLVERGVGSQTEGGEAAGAVAHRATHATELPLTAVAGYPTRLAFEGEFISHFYGYTRAFLKVQTGCDSRCAYCVIPLARGPARTMPQAEVLEQVRLLAARDYQEVVLTGIDLGSWGRDTGEGTLADLLARLLGETRPARYRLSSIEPLGVDSRLLDTLESMGERMAHHFHLPLQSGADRVLTRMNRPYTAADYLGVVTRLARRFPQAALGADVIVGFPGETEEEFEETHAFLEHPPLTYFHVFSYSDRPGTAAAAMSPKVGPETIHTRSLRLRELGERKNAAFRDRLVGTQERALILRERTEDGRLVGLTGNYLEVLVAGEDSLANRFARVRLERVLPDGRFE
ncbi:MAG: tRNA (N(6)-L-threonylcarbamoyladenosine(37)-C(2))-methylthiotransferase MtaB, partial [Acidobacteria bacterium RBG_16_64_8]